jgi:hypothetical protein
MRPHDDGQDAPSNGDATKVSKLYHDALLKSKYGNIYGKKTHGDQQGWA